MGSEIRGSKSHQGLWELVNAGEGQEHPLNQMPYSVLCLDQSLYHKLQSGQIEDAAVIIRVFKNEFINCKTVFKRYNKIKIQDSNFQEGIQKDGRIREYTPGLQ